MAFTFNRELLFLFFFTLFSSIYVEGSSVNSDKPQSSVMSEVIPAEEVFNTNESQKSVGLPEFNGPFNWDFVAEQSNQYAFYTVSFNYSIAEKIKNNVKSYMLNWAINHSNLINIKINLQDKGYNDKTFSFQAFFEGMHQATIYSYGTFIEAYFSLYAYRADTYCKFEWMIDEIDQSIEMISDNCLPANPDLFSASDFNINNEYSKLLAKVDKASEEYESSFEAMEQFRRLEPRILRHMIANGHFDISKFKVSLKKNFSEYSTENSSLPDQVILILTSDRVTCEFKEGFGKIKEAKKKRSGRNSFRGEFISKFALSDLRDEVTCKGNDFVSSVR